MRVLVLGATGRVGSAAVSLAIARGYDVTAFVRNPSKFVETNARIAIGDVTRPDTLADALRGGIDAVVNALGVDPLKPSTFVTDAARIVVGAMTAAGIERYVAVSGTANMPATLLGGVAVWALEHTPVRHAIEDHRGAYDIVIASDLVWTLAGCPWIKDGPVSDHYHEHDSFPGGMKTIHAGEVAHFLVKTLDDPAYYRRLVGIWH